MRIAKGLGKRGMYVLGAVSAGLALVGVLAPRLLSEEAQRRRNGSTVDSAIEQNSRDMFERGRQIFRYDTFGDQAFWGDKLKLHQAIAGSKLGGIGGGVSPATALAVGLKVDVDSLPQSLRASLAAGQVNLSDPATTLALLKLNAVVGVTGIFDSRGGCNPWEFSARCAIRAWIIRLRPRSGTGWMAGPIAI